jgi:hypothetical protein
MLCEITLQQCSLHFVINLPGHCAGKPRATFSVTTSLSVVHGVPFDIGAERVFVTYWLPCWSRASHASLCAFMLRWACGRAMAMPGGCYSACIELVNLQRAGNNCTIKIGRQLSLLILSTILKVSDSNFVQDAILRNFSLFLTIMHVTSTSFSSRCLAYLQCHQRIIVRKKCSYPN